MVNKLYLGTSFDDEKSIALDFDEKVEKAIEFYVEEFGEEFRAQITDRLLNATYLFVDTLKYQTKLLKKTNWITITDFKTQLNDIATKIIYDAMGIVDRQQFSTIIFNFYLNKDYFIKQFMTDERFAFQLSFSLCKYYRKDYEFENIEEYIKYLKTDNHIEQIYDELAPKYELYREYYSLIIRSLSFINLAEETFGIQGSRNNMISRSGYLFNLDLNEMFSKDENIQVLSDFIQILPEFYTEENKSNFAKLFNKLFKTNLTYDEFVNSAEFGKLLIDYKRIMLSNFKLVEQIVEDAFDNCLKKSDAEKERLILKMMARNMDYVTINAHISIITKYLYGNMGYALINSAPNTNNNLCVLPIDCPSLAITHENAHLISTQDKNKDLGYQTKVGLKVEGSKLQEFTMLNELITEYFTYKIYSKMIKSNFEFGLAEQFTSRYVCLLPYLNRLFNKFEHEIKQAYMGESLKPLFDIAPMQKWIELEDVIQKCDNYISVKGPDALFEADRQLNNVNKTEIPSNLNRADVIKYKQLLIKLSLIIDEIIQGKQVTV